LRIEIATNEETAPPSEHLPTGSPGGDSSIGTEFRSWWPCIWPSTCLRTLFGGLRELENPCAIGFDKNLGKCEHNSHIRTVGNLGDSNFGAPKMKKEPRQQRARATVEAILEAAARILDRRGWKGFTTNAVADVAGVSIGSLYQYFPNKLALVETIQRRHFDDVLSALRRADEQTSRTKRIEGLVSGMITAHSIHPSLHRVLLEDVPRAKISKSMHQNFEREYWGLYTKLIAANEASAASPRSVVRAQILSAAISGAIHDAARRGTLSSPAFEQELIRLVDAYLCAVANDQNKPSLRTAGMKPRSG
jgi:AcrR family transcriptional regulator